MEVKENNFKKLFKRFGALSIVCVIAVVIAVTIAVCVPRGAQEVSTTRFECGLPMNGASLQTEYDENLPQHYPKQKRFQMHMGVDIVSLSNDLNVFAIFDGTVSNVEIDGDRGNSITITHADGFESVYSSLADDITLKVGDKVKKGQKIGNASDSDQLEEDLGEHLHLEILKDGNFVDPNLYLYLSENK